MEGGLETVYHSCRAELLRFLLARTGSAAEAEDILQDIWLRVGQGRSGPVANGRAYLYRVAQNLVLDRLREARRRAVREQGWMEMAAGVDLRHADPADPNADALAQMTEREEVARLASAIANLPAGARRAFQLHKLEGLSHDEVAQRLGISRSGVEKHMAVAMKYLRRALCED
ncbi:MULTISPECIES: RNA polymerase sigma factor [Sphingobium]|jgi:RNA polymerase sigma factor (sigma-70 family)|uniref:RNA polymerase sigma factor n=2 Tax=Sphingobium fuliginis (strain ATCC 27551) TaxID=336203 RepID=A0A292ZGH2_SPHSA|nr:MULTISPECIES: RNA polymerase sigma factor [Sphingobium]OAP30944.1 RNA polymerase subunit sigma-70 [Sphingobium sp. 20006FA]KXU31742.1 RNA polymerase subunit sigma-70 [Sphingobium sp. AM]KYC31042.1 RNA polymerase subunit sigma-70 [Sphingobium sp. 22B]QDC35957.1 RNA polymerase sigma factor [Sphingobium fuliginis ATCC 27551]QOT71775.1 RNA polymerase sigma factor [Sphingobium fuliginis]